MNESNPITPFAATIGLDWANQKHDLWIRPANGSKPEHLVLLQTPEALHEWVAQIRERFANQPVAIAIETTRGAVVSALLQYDFLVLFPINPQMLCKYREAFCMSGAKDDRTDAMLLEEYLRLHQDKLRRLQPDTELTRKLSGLVENRREFVNERTRLVNQLHSLLKTYYPLVPVLFEDLTTSLVTQFLLKWSDLDSLKKAGSNTLRNFFYAHNARSSKIMERRLQAVSAALPLTTDPALIEPAALKVKALAGMLEVVHEAIKTLDDKIKESMDLHPDAFIFRSFPGAGPALAPRLLVAFGTNRERFAEAQEIQQFYGTAPVKKQSGKSQVIHMRYRCPKFGRQSFHENACVALKIEGWTKRFYAAQRARGKGHHAAARALSFKLTRIYFCCWQKRQPYDAAHYEKALVKHGSAIALPPEETEVAAVETKK